MAKFPRWSLLDPRIKRGVPDIAQSGVCGFGVGVMFLDFGHIGIQIPDPLEYRRLIGCDCANSDSVSQEPASDVRAVRFPLRLVQ